MDPRLLRYYNRELQFMREMGGEFAREFPKIAGRLGLDGFECADPYVERLLEGFSFLAARVQVRIDAEFPRFTQHLLEMVYPHYLAPSPAMAVVQFFPDPKQGSLLGGFQVPRGTALRTPATMKNAMPCEFRTAQDVVLWPIEIASAEYVLHPRDPATDRYPELARAQAGLRLKIRARSGVTLDKLSLDALPLFLRGTGELPVRLYAQLVGSALGAVVRSGAGGGGPLEILDRGSIRRLGFEDGQALLPCGPESFAGYRLLQEFFAFPDRFLFVEIGGLAPVVRRTKGQELEILVLFGTSDVSLQGTLGAANCVPFCTPAINLFPKSADRIHVTGREQEHHVVPDRTRPLDFEVHSITRVVGIGSQGAEEREFLPAYALSDLSQKVDIGAYYTVHRTPRVIPASQRRTGFRTDYVGNEVYLSLVDTQRSPVAESLKYLAVDTLCTNRDLPLQMIAGAETTDFELDVNAPVVATRCAAGPSRPYAAPMGGESVWRIVSHLALNYLTLVDTDERQGASALRELLDLYVREGDVAASKHVQGLMSVSSRPIHRRISQNGHSAYGRGLELTVQFDETAFAGSGVFILGAVLAEFFRRYVSLNSFTETVIRTLQHGEVMRWQATTGRRQQI